MGFACPTALLSAVQKMAYLCPLLLHALLHTALLLRALLLNADRPLHLSSSLQQEHF